MKKFYSQIKKNVLLHVINYKDDIVKRTNIAPENEFLQLATLKLQKGDTFKAHKHLWKEIKYNNVIAQESWIIISGSVKVFLYDLDDKLISEEIISQGDCSMTFQGGHNYLSLDNNTIVYEYKTGPYMGIDKDKDFINED